MQNDFRSIKAKPALHTVACQFKAHITVKTIIGNYIFYFDKQMLSSSEKYPPYYFNNLFPIVTKRADTKSAKALCRG